MWEGKTKGPEHKKGADGNKAAPEKPVPAPANPVWDALALHVQPKAAVGAADDPIEPEDPGNQRDRISAAAPLRNIQAKLAVNAPGDIFEREADRVAERISQNGEAPVLPITGITRVPVGGAPPIHRRSSEFPAPAPGPVDPSLEARIQSPSGGEPLAPAIRRDMETALDTDLSHVRVHDGAAHRADADRLNAKAFTHGSNIWIGSRNSADDRKLMAHEITHVVQQTGTDASTVFRQPDRDLRKLEPFFPYQNHEYIEHFAEEIKRDLRAEMRVVTLTTGSPFISWVGGSGQRFIEAALNILLARTGKDLTAELNRYLTPAAVFRAVDRGREIGDIDTKWFGGKNYFPAVALELRSVLAQQLAASLERIAPQYLAARNQAALALEARTKQPVAVAPEPDPASIIASAPIDRLVIPALVAGGVTVDLTKYRAANPEQRRAHELQRLRHIAEGDWRFEAVQGLWSWIRVQRPADATVEEVAWLLYGDETRSNLIVPAPPFFGFNPDRLSGPMLQRWEALAGKDEDDVQFRVLKDVPRPKPGQRETTLQHGYDVERDAAAELLYSAQADEITGIQARDAQPTGATRADIVSRLVLCVKLLDRSAADAKRFNLDFEPARMRLEKRRAAIQALVNPRLAYRWDGQSIGQLEILQRAMAGLRVAATNHAAMEKGKPEHEPVGAPSPYTLLITPVMELGKAYVEAARVSELLVTARQKLAEADDRAKRLPLDFAEARLRIMRQTLAYMASSKLRPGQGYSQAELEKMGYADLIRGEARLRHQLAAARESFTTNPDAAMAQFNKIGPELNKVQLGTELGGIIEHLVGLIATVDTGMRESSGLGAIVTSGEYKVEIANILLWGKRWSRLWERYRKGESGTADFKQELKELGENPKWKTLFVSVLTRLQDLKQREAWINFGARIAALVAIALVTGGVGAIAEGAGLGLWTTAGLEALTFTTLTLPFEEKPSVEGFFLHFFENWVTFGIVKGASALYEAAVGPKFAKTLLGKGVGQLVGFATATTTMIMQAEIESFARQGRSLSTGEVKWIVGESTAVTFATILATRSARPFLTELRTRGQSFRAEIDAINAMRAQNLALAEAVKETKSFALAKTLAEADAKQSELEGEVLKKLGRDGVGAKDKDGHALSDDQKAVVAELTESKGGKPSPIAAAVTEEAGVARARTLVELEPAGPDVFLTDPGKDIIDYAKRFAVAGAEITGPEYNADGSRSILVDFKDGHPFEVMERAPGADRVTRPAEPPPHAGGEAHAEGGKGHAAEAAPKPDAVKARAAEAAPEIQVPQARAAEAARDAGRAQADQLARASTDVPPEQRRALIKRNGQKLLDAANREYAAKKAEADLIKERIARERRKIARRQAEIDEARKEVPGKTKTTKQMDAEVERINERIRKFAATLYDLEARAAEIGGELSRLNELKDMAQRMIDGRETDTLPCFPPETLVWTTDGPRPIEDLPVGTAVTSWDEEKGRVCAGEITHVHRHRTRWLYRIVTTAGSVDATGDHRFFAEDAGWTAARDLRAGMRLRAAEGSPAIESVSLVERETPTWNLSIAPCPTYFVGPGFLVHNAGTFNLGNIIIYEGYNEAFPDLIYIGQTNDLKVRERDHQAEGRDGLKRKFLTDEERLFFEFKSGMKLRPRLTGLNELTADYFEQVNKNWEALVRGDDKVMNRIEIVAEKNWPDVVKRVTELYCPK